jgi:hypothetical protein
MGFSFLLTPLLPGRLYLIHFIVKGKALGEPGGVLMHVTVTAITRICSRPEEGSLLARFQESMVHFAKGVGCDMIARVQYAGGSHC